MGNTEEMHDSWRGWGKYDDCNKDDNDDDCNKDDNDDDDDDNDDDDVFGVKKQVGGRVPSQLTSLTLQPTL